MATFKETLEMYRVACKAGDIPSIAKMAGVSAQTVRNTFKRTYAIELTAAEKRVIEICKEYFRDRFAEAQKIEAEVRKIAEGSDQ